MFNACIYTYCICTNIYIICVQSVKMIFVCRYSRVHVAFSDSRESKSYKYLKWTHLTPCSYQSPKQQILEETRMNQVTNIMHRSNISGDNEIAQGENDHRLWGMWGLAISLVAMLPLLPSAWPSPRSMCISFHGNWQLLVLLKRWCAYIVYMYVHMFFEVVHIDWYVSAGHYCQDDHVPTKNFDDHRTYGYVLQVSLFMTSWMSSRWPIPPTSDYLSLTKCIHRNSQIIARMTT